jgi:HAD superfamily hydrolase (TIGR01549 family)
MKHPEKPVVSAVLFDWDLTLAHRSAQPLLLAANHLKRRMIQPGSLSSTAAATVILSPAMRRAERSVRRILRPRLNQAAQQTVLSLLDEDIPVFIISNGETDMVREEARSLLGEEIANKIHFLAGRKPDAAQITQALQEHGITPGPDVFMVGDTFSTDILAAINAGLTPVLISARPRELSAMLKHNDAMPDVKILTGSSEELPEAIRRLQGDPAAQR